MSYARVVLPLKLDKTYHYLIPDEWEGKLQAGQRVVVSLGPTRFYTGIVCGIDTDLPKALLNNKTIKTISDVPEKDAILGQKDLELWHWISRYYMCTEGDVLRIALPSGLLPTSATIIRLNEDFVASKRLSEKQQNLLDFLARQPKKNAATIAIQRALGRISVDALTELVRSGAIRVEEELIRKYKPRTETCLHLSPGFRTEEQLTAAISSIKRAPKQQAILYEWLEMCEDGVQEDYTMAVKLAEFTKGDANRSNLVRALCKRGIFQTYEKEISRIAPPRVKSSDITRENLIQQPFSLNPNAAVHFLETRDITEKEQLLIQQIADTINKGKQVLLLSPITGEVETKDCFTEKLRKATNGRLLVYDTTISDAVKVETFLKTATSDEPFVIMGQRNAVLLPFKNLGLIVVDEEHEYALKHQATPRFHARDVAIWLGVKNNIPVLLTSETPSAETLFNVMRGKYRRISLPGRERYRFRKNTVIEAIDLRKTPKQQNGIISPALAEAIRQTIKAGQRVLLLQNRRGYAPFLVCRACGERYKCPKCDVSLTYHRSNHKMICHYCGYNAPVPTACPNCHTMPETANEPVMEAMGYGSERVEQEVAIKFPEASVLRLDSDVLLSAKQRSEVQQLIDSGNVDIIVGTQLIKGQPIWNDVSLIAVIRLDAILGYLDFRSYERAYQLLDQLLIRGCLSNSENTPTRLLLQTYDTENPFIEQLKKGDYNRFIENQLEEREICGFPPFVRLSTIIIKGFDENLVDSCAENLCKNLCEFLPEGAVSQPQKPSVARIDMQYIRQITLKRNPQTDYRIERTAIQKALSKTLQDTPAYKKNRIIIDIDPL
ncbi:replication restart helicase PriA [Porphyromonas macacae]|uniref:replication restart helicase PriA n=1 Tax=Porphyromonas macacae TaxID=28115 RepID=UPI0035A02108